MAKKLELLLTENVEGQGIVGDVVKVSKGFARNYLLPRNYATTPSQEKLASLAGKRADAQKLMAEQRKQREALIAKLQGYELTMIRSCNDLGILYGAVTQHEIAKALGDAGFAGIKDREVRLGQVIKRIDAYDLHVKFDADLDATIKLHIKPDRELDLRRARDEEAAAAGGAEGGAEGAPGAEGAAKDAPARDGKPSRDGPRADRGERGFGDREDRDDRRDRRDRERAERLKASFDKPVHKGFGFGDAKKDDAGAGPAAAKSDGAKDAGAKEGGKKSDKAPKGEKSEKAKK